MQTRRSGVVVRRLLAGGAIAEPLPALAVRLHATPTHAQLGSFVSNQNYLWFSFLQCACQKSSYIFRGLSLRRLPVTGAVQPSTLVTTRSSRPTAPTARPSKLPLASPVGRPMSSEPYVPLPFRHFFFLPPRIGHFPRFYFSRRILPCLSAIQTTFSCVALRSCTATLPSFSYCFLCRLSTLPYHPHASSFPPMGRAS